MRSDSSTYSTYFHNSRISPRHARLDDIEEEPVETRYRNKPNAKLFIFTVGVLIGTLCLLNGAEENDANISLRRALTNEMTAKSLPKYTTNFADITTPLKPEEQPFFWYIPKSGGSALQKIFGQCLGLVSCSAFGKDNGLDVSLIVLPVDICIHSIRT